MLVRPSRNHIPPGKDPGTEREVPNDRCLATLQSLSSSHGYPGEAAHDRLKTRLSAAYSQSQEWRNQRLLEET